MENITYRLLHLVSLEQIMGSKQYAGNYNTGYIQCLRNKQTAKQDKQGKIKVGMRPNQRKGVVKYQKLHSGYSEQDISEQVSQKDPCNISNSLFQNTLLSTPLIGDKLPISHIRDTRSITTGSVSLPVVMYSLDVFSSCHRSSVSYGYLKWRRKRLVFSTFN